MLNPVQVVELLERIEEDLAVRQDALESAAENWFRAKRAREKARAVAFLKAQGSVAERHAVAESLTALDGSDAEAEYEAMKAVVRVLETRASIGQTLARTNGRLS